MKDTGSQVENCSLGKCPSASGAVGFVANFLKIKSARETGETFCGNPRSSHGVCSL